MKLEKFYKERDLALQKAAAKIQKMSSKQRLELAIKIGKSAELIRQYGVGDGKEFETALQILEA